MSSLLYRIGRACYRHGVRVLLVWLAVLAALGAAVGLMGARSSTTTSRSPARPHRSRSTS